MRCTKFSRRGCASSIRRTYRYLGTAVYTTGTGIFRDWISGPKFSNTVYTRVHHALHVALEFDVLSSSTVPTVERKSRTLELLAFHEKCRFCFFPCFIHFAHEKKQRRHYS
jgi:hypothetical protein